MSSKFKVRETLLILKSGVAGALAFTGLCIIVFLLGATARQSYISHLYSKIIFHFSFGSIFLFTGALGFILGIAVRRRVRRIQDGTVLAGLISIPLILVVWLLHVVHVGVPHTLKLADCTNNIINIHLKVPEGHGYRLDLVASDSKPSPSGYRVSSYKFSGRIRISSRGSLISDFAIGSDTAGQAGGSFILTGDATYNRNVPPLSQFVEAQKDYDLQVTLNPMPPPSSSILLYWLRSTKGL